MGAAYWGMSLKDASLKVGYVLFILYAAPFISRISVPDSSNIVESQTHAAHNSDSPTNGLPHL